MDNKDKQNSPAEETREKFDIDEYVALQRELNELRRDQGIEPEKKEGGISRLISSYFERKDAKEKVTVNKKKHLLLCIFLGWAGGHRFHARQYLLGIVYLLTCWSGFSIAMSIIDLLIIIPIPADENGNIQI